MKCVSVTLFWWLRVCNKEGNWRPKSAALSPSLFPQSGFQEAKKTRY